MSRPRPHIWTSRDSQSAAALLRALEIDMKGVTGFTLRVGVNRITTVKITRHVTGDQLEKLIVAIEKFSQPPFSEVT